MFQPASYELAGNANGHFGTSSPEFDFDTVEPRSATFASSYASTSDTTLMQTPTPTKHRSRLSSQQTNLLEHTFQMNTHPDLSHRELLATHAGLNAKQVNVWFQNRRQKLKHSAVRAAAGKPPTRQRKDPHLPVAAIKRNPASCNVRVPADGAAASPHGPASPPSQTDPRGIVQCHGDSDLQRRMTWNGLANRPSAPTLFARRRTASQAQPRMSHSTLSLRAPVAATHPTDGVAQTPSLATASSLWTEASLPEPSVMSAASSCAAASNFEKQQQELLDGLASLNNLSCSPAQPWQAQRAARAAMQALQLHLPQAQSGTLLREHEAMHVDSTSECTTRASAAQQNGQTLGLGLDVAGDWLAEASAAEQTHPCESKWIEAGGSDEDALPADLLPEMLQTWLSSTPSTGAVGSDSRRHSTAGFGTTGEAAWTHLWPQETDGKSASTGVLPASTSKGAPSLSDPQHGSGTPDVQPHALAPACGGEMTLSADAAPASVTGNLFSDPTLNSLLCGMDMRDLCTLPPSESTCPALPPTAAASFTK